MPALDTVEEPDFFVPLSLPSYYEMEEPETHQELEGHRKLWLRVWWRAVCDYVYYKDKKDPDSRELANDAADWLFGESCYGVCPPDCEDARLSFEAFCVEFDMDIAKVRRWILHLTVGEINKIGRNLP